MAKPSLIPTAWQPPTLTPGSHLDVSEEVGHSGWVVARCATEKFSTTCAVPIESCEGWWLSGCRGSMSKHWRLKLEVSWVWLPAAAGLFTFLYFCLIPSKFICSVGEVQRCSVRACSGSQILLASFPGSHAPECEHWSCAGVESLVFFLTWEAVKVERR